MAPQTLGDLRFVLIWSEEHRQWCRPDGKGYTNRIEEAGLYDAETVVKRWLHGSSDFHRVVKVGATAPRRKARP